MARTFDLILTGNALPGRNREEVARNLAELIRVPEERALGLLSGCETVVKRGLDGLTLHRYLEALQKAGVETRKKETTPEPQGDSPATVRCPACGKEQPDLTVCTQCGTNMAVLAAAQASAARDPPRRPPAAVPKVAPREDDGEIPRYRRSRLFEVLLFLFVSVLWGFLAMTDRTRGTGMRVLGGVTFVVFGTLIVLSFTPIFGPDAEGERAHQALLYAAEVADEAGRYAVSNQRLAERTASIDLPANRPDSVDSVDIGMGGRIRVTLGDKLKKASGGVIVMTPIVEGGVIRWSCGTEGIPAGYFKGCD